MEYLQDPDLTDKVLMEHAGNIPPQTMYKIAVEYLKISKTQIQFWQEKWRDDVVRINFEILDNWRKRNRGPNAKDELGMILKRSQFYIAAQQYLTYVCYVFMICIVPLIAVLMNGHTGECLHSKYSPGITWYTCYRFSILVWWPDSVGGLDFEYARSPRQLNGNNFFVSGRT